MLKGFRPVRSGPTRSLASQASTAELAFLHGPGEVDRLMATGTRRSVAVAGRGCWQTESDGAKVTNVGPFELVVFSDTPGGYARFLVLRCPGGTETCGSVLLASGTRDNTGAAMEDAEATAARLFGQLEFCATASSAASRKVAPNAATMPRI